MKVKNVMKSPVITIQQGANLREAVALMSTAGVSGLPVVDNDGVLAGLVTEHDIIKAMLPTYEDIIPSDTGLLDANIMENRVYEARNKLVDEVMTRNVIAVDEDDTLLKAATTMILKKVKRLPVLCGRKPIGIVSRIDVIETMLKAAEV